MKVCQILGGKGSGGLEKHVYELSISLKEKNLDVTVIAHEDFKSLFEEVKFIPLDLTKSRINIFVLFKLYKTIKDNNFDIIHCHANKATYMLTKIKPYISPKIVSTLHNYKNNIKSFEKCDYVITVSNKISEKLKTKNKKTIYNGLIQKKVEKINLYQKYRIKNDKFIICGVGRFAHAKRFDILISSLKYLENIHLILIGDGEDKNKLINLSNELNLKNKITFTGMIPNDLTKSIMASSNLFVLTSDKEGFGYVFAESLMVDTPLISTDVADIKKFIGEEYIIPFNDSFSLSKKIEYIRQNYEKVLLDFEENIFEQTKNIFTVENMTVEIIKIYNKVLNK